MNTMRLLTFLLFSLCLGQAAFGAAPTLSLTTSSRQASRIGLPAKEYNLSLSRPLPETFLFTDSVAAPDLYDRGRQDARLFYRHRGAFWIPFGITVASLTAPLTLALPGAGTGLYFLPGLGSSLYQGITKPKEKNLKQHDTRYHNPELIKPTDTLFQDSRYVEGYQKGARRRKTGKALAGFGTGVGAAFLLVLVIAASVMSAH